MKEGIKMSHKLDVVLREVGSLGKALMNTQNKLLGSLAEEEVQVWFID